MSILWSVLINQVNFKENVSGVGPRKLSIIQGVRIKQMSIKQGSSVVSYCLGSILKPCHRKGGGLKFKVVSFFSWLLALNKNPATLSEMVIITSSNYKY